MCERERERVSRFMYEHQSSLTNYTCSYYYYYFHFTTRNNNNQRSIQKGSSSIAQRCPHPNFLVTDSFIYINFEFCHDPLLLFGIMIYSHYHGYDHFLLRQDYNRRSYHSSCLLLTPNTHLCQLSSNNHPLA